MKKLIMTFIAFFGFMCIMNAQSFIKNESLFKKFEQQIEQNVQLAQTLDNSLAAVAPSEGNEFSYSLKSRVIKMYRSFIEVPENNSMESLNTFVDDLELVRNNNSKNNNLRLEVKDYLLHLVTE